MVMSILELEVKEVVVIVLKFCSWVKSSKATLFLTIFVVYDDYENLKKFKKN